MGENRKIHWTGELSDIYPNPDRLASREAIITRAVYTEAPCPSLNLKLRVDESWLEREIDITASDLLGNLGPVEQKRRAIENINAIYTDFGIKSYEQLVGKGVIALMFHDRLLMGLKRAN